MKWWLVSGGVALASLTTLYLVQRSQKEPVEELPDNSDEGFTQQVQEEAFLERQKVNEDYWNRWKAKNITTMSDKMWEYQMARYEMYEEGKLPTYRWDNPLMPPSIFYA